MEDTSKNRRGEGVGARAAGAALRGLPEGVYREWLKGSTGNCVPLGGAAVYHLLLGRRDDGACLVSAHDTGRHCGCSDRARPPEGSHSDEIAAGSEDRPPRAAAREDDVGNDSVRVHARHASSRQTLALTEWNTDSDDFVTAGHWGLCRVAARERHRSCGTEDRGIDPDDRDITCAIRGKNARRDLDGGRQLHLRPTSPVPMTR